MDIVHNHFAAVRVPERILGANGQEWVTKDVGNSEFELSRLEGETVSGDWLPTPEIARNRANSWVSQDSKWETGLGGWGTRIRT